MGNYDPNDQEVMEANEITFDGEKYCFKTYRHANLRGALLQAKGQGFPGGLTSAEKRLKTNEKGEAKEKDDGFLKGNFMPLLWIIFVGSSLYGIKGILDLPRGFRDGPSLFAFGVAWFYQFILLIQITKNQNKD